MKMEIATEAALFLFWEYQKGIFVSVKDMKTRIRHKVFEPHKEIIMAI
jgi:hypothetical protein